MRELNAFCQPPSGKQFNGAAPLPYDQMKLFNIPSVYSDQVYNLIEKVSANDKLMLFLTLGASLYNNYPFVTETTYKVDQEIISQLQGLLTTLNENQIHGFDFNDPNVSTSTKVKLGRLVNQMDLHELFYSLIKVLNTLGDAPDCINADTLSTLFRMHRVEERRDFKYLAEVISDLNQIFNPKKKRKSKKK